MPTEDQVHEALKQVKYPGFTRDIVSFGIVKRIAVSGNDVAVILNHRSSLVTDNVPPPSFTVTRPALSGTAFFLSGLGMYLALQVLPLAAPIGLWAGLNPVGLKTLLLQPDGPAPSEDGEAPVRGD